MTLPDDIGDHLAYDPMTGRFSWRTPRSNAVNGEAGCVHPRGYLIIKFRGVPYPAHRLGWFLATGNWPSGLIDHKNGDPLDNRLSNLRLADSAQNGWNARRSGAYLKGVSCDAGRYRARIAVRGDVIRLGSFDTEHEAHAAYCAAALKYHGEFARTE